MSEGPKQNAPDGSRSGGSEGRMNRALDLMKPCWPAGLPLPPSKDVTCSIPEDLTVVLSREAFEQLFGYAYSTTSEICCLGTVRQEGARFRIERFYLVPQSGIWATQNWSRRLSQPWSRGSSRWGFSSSCSRSPASFCSSNSFVLLPEEVGKVGVGGIALLPEAPLSLLAGAALFLA